MNAERKELNLALLGGLAVAAATLLFFGWLAQEVLAGGTARLDAAVRDAVHAHASPALTWAMRTVTWLGSATVLGPLTLVLVAHWARNGRARTAVLFVVTVLGAELLEQLLKLMFHRPRPIPFFGLESPVGYSFPSGHAMVSCCFYGALAVLARKWPRWAVWTCATLLVAVIGLSRIYLGVHYPSDVMAGFAGAVVWVLTVRTVYVTWIRPR